MNNYFLITVETSFIILAILMIRRMIWKKCNPNIVYFLWIFMAVRMIFPFHFAVELPAEKLPDPINKLIGIAQKEEPGILLLEEYFLTDLYRKTESGKDTADDDNAGDTSTDGIADGSLNTSVSTLMNESAGVNESANLNESTNVNEGADTNEIRMPNIAETINAFLRAVWLAGGFGILCYFIFVNLYFYKRILRRKIRNTESGIPIYESENVDGMVGIFRPKIILSTETCRHPEHEKYIVMHELEHYYIRDNFWILIKNICLMLQWYNPLVWIAYSKIEEDCELACDSRVIRQLSEKEREEYAELLFRLSCPKRYMPAVVSTMTGRKNYMKRRITSIFMKQSGIRFLALVFLLLCTTTLFFFNFSIYAAKSAENPETYFNIDRSEVEEKKKPVSEETLGETLNVVMDDPGVLDAGIDGRQGNYYCTDIVRGGNHYWIDEDGVLWGEGYSEFGQLKCILPVGHHVFEPVKIADDVIHVDYSGEYFMIFLTSDHRLYGLGGNAAGILDGSLENDYDCIYMHGITEPKLLMEGVSYAKCGYTTILVLLENSEAWLLGNDHFAPFYKETYCAPRMVMSNAKFIESYSYTHAVIDENNNLWTWGANENGQCAGGDENWVERPQKVFENAACVWMGMARLKSDGKPVQNEILAVRKADGSIWGCGERIGSNLCRISIRAYEPTSLHDVELSWTKEKVAAFLEEREIDYYLNHTDEEKLLGFSANQNHWDFVFDGQGYLIQISSDTDDEMMGQKNLVYGNTAEKVEEIYGGDYERIDLSDNWFLMRYDMDEYFFDVFVYKDLGCGCFYKTKKGFIVK